MSKKKKYSPVEVKVCKCQTVHDSIDLLISNSYFFLMTNRRDYVKLLKPLDIIVFE